MEDTLLRWIDFFLNFAAVLSCFRGIQCLKIKEKENPGRYRSVNREQVVQSKVNENSFIT